MRSSDVLHPLCCAWKRGPPGWWQGSSSSHVSPSMSNRVGIYPLVFWKIYKVRCPTPWPFSRTSRAPLHFLRPPFDCFVYDVFRGGSKVVGKLDEMFCTIRLECSVQYSQWSPLLLLGCYVLTAALFWRRSCGIVIVLYLTSGRVSKVFVGTTSQLQEMSQEVFSLTYVLVFPQSRTYWGSLFPFLRRISVCIRFFCFLSEGEIIK